MEPVNATTQYTWWAAKAGRIVVNVEPGERPHLDLFGQGQPDDPQEALRRLIRDATEALALLDHFERAAEPGDEMTDDDRAELAGLIADDLEIHHATSAGALALRLGVPDDDVISALRWLEGRGEARVHPAVGDEPDSDIWGPPHLATVDQASILEAMADLSSKREIAKLAGMPSDEATSILGSLSTLGWVVGGPDQFRTTPPGDRALNRYRDMLADQSKLANFQKGDRAAYILKAALRELVQAWPDWEAPEGLLVGYQAHGVPVGSDHVLPAVQMLKGWGLAESTDNPYQVRVTDHGRRFFHRYLAGS